MKISFARLQPVFEKARPYTERARLALHEGLRAVQEHPRYIRSFSLLPLLVSWFVGLHHEPYRSAAHRGFFLSTIFLVLSSIVFFAFDNLRVYFGGAFFLQLTFLLLQTAISVAYIAISLRLAYGEFKGLPVSTSILDRMKDRIIEMI